MKRLSTTDFTAIDESFEQEVHADRGVDILETVRRLFPKIQQLREQGVPVSQVLALLNQRGLTLSASTLHRYMKRVGKERRRIARVATPAAPALPTRQPQLATPAVAPAPVAQAGQPVSKAPPPGEDGRKEVEQPLVTAGHFMPVPDSERI